MKKLKLYIETSAWNFYFADDAPEKRDITKEFFETIFSGAYDIYASKVVLDEISRAPEQKRQQLSRLIEKASPFMLEMTQDAEILAQKYIQRGIIPENKQEDALHVAVATVWEIDAVVTWNYKHIANIRKSELFFGANLEEGYLKPIKLVTPMEVANEN